MHKYPNDALFFCSLSFVPPMHYIAYTTTHSLTHIFASTNPSINQSINQSQTGTRSSRGRRLPPRPNQRMRRRPGSTLLRQVPMTKVNATFGPA
jgi:hypothetical protein